MGSAETLPGIPDKTPKGIPIESIIEYRSKGLSTREIAALTNCTHSNIVQRLQRIAEDIDTLPHYKSHRADILAINGRRILNSITDEDIKKAPAGQRVMMYGILYDKERLERGESTHNIASIHADIQAMKAAKQANKPQDIEDISA